MTTKLDKAMALCAKRLHPDNQLVGTIRRRRYVGQLPESTVRKLSIYELSKVLDTVVFAEGQGFMSHFDITEPTRKFVDEVLDLVGKETDAEVLRQKLLKLCSN